jgi:hypothetical protein
MTEQPEQPDLTDLTDQPALHDQHDQDDPADRGAPPPTPIERLVGSPTIRSGYTSAVTHVAILTLLALVFCDDRIPARRPRLVIETAAPSAEEIGIDVPVEMAAPDLPAGGAADVDLFEPLPAAVPPAPVPPLETVAVAALPAVSDLVAVVATADDAATGREVPASGGPGTPFAGRLPAARAGLLAARGGSAASEAAVERGLEWLALHQARDGSWRFDLSDCRCDGGCRNPGTVASTTAATGLALLPFLGAGHTHLEGRHRDTVTRGLYYLMSRQQPTPRGGDLSEGTMYGHGVATLALAEALGMTRDDALEKPLADAVRFIVTAQDLHGGGWRYLPGQAGDTTVTAWQFAALKSASLAGVTVPSPTIDGVARFLDRVQTPDGTAYGYLAPEARPCTSAIGLFCRLHLGWDRRDALDRGLATLATPGPAPAQVYRNFYLAQALLQTEHRLWPRWNARNRDQLVSLQGTTGHEAGSWFLPERDAAPGGRLAHTALAVLTLEVYYRILPLYRAEAVAAGW